MRANSLAVAGSSNPINRTDRNHPYPAFCQLPNGQIVPYVDMGNGFAFGGYGENATNLGAGTGIGNAVNNIAMPTVDKPGGIAGGGKSGPVTSPASGILRDIFGGARFSPLRPIAGTTSIGGAIGHILPYFGTGLMVLDAATLLKAMKEAPFCAPVA
jgi:hypothetical protein